VPKLRKLSYFLLALFLIQLPQFNATATASQAGDDCKKVGQTIRKGKNIFICESTFIGKVLIQQKTFIASSKNLKLKAGEFVEELSALDSKMIIDFVSSEIALQTEISNLNSRLEEINSLTSRYKSEKLQAESDIATLPVRINQAKLQMEQAKSSIVQPQQNYLALNAQLNALSYEYSSAERAKGAYLACRVLTDFGFTGGGCGSYNTYYDSVISRYNSLQYQVSSAKALFDSYNSSYNSYLQNYNSILNSQSQNTLRISEANRNIAALAIELRLKSNDLLVKQKVINSLSKVKNNSDFYVNNGSNLGEEISSVVSGSSKSWSQKLLPLFRKSNQFIFEFKLIESSRSTLPRVQTNTDPSQGSNTQPAKILLSATLDRAVYAPGEVATLLITGRDATGNLVPDGTQLAASQESISTSMFPNKYLSIPKSADSSQNGRWTYRFIIESAPGTYSGTFKIGNMTEQKIPYVVRYGG
jgi:predicted  nucleic acid-binding Zn-ribbon protein